MPLYDFVCKTCENKFEEFSPIYGLNPTCPQCKGKTKRLISRVFGIVKGSENRTLDYIIGADAEKKWKMIEERKKRRKQNV